MNDAERLMTVPVPGQAGRLPDRIVSHDPERPSMEEGTKVYPPVKGGWRLHRPENCTYLGPHGWRPAAELAMVFASEEDARDFIASAMPRALVAGAEPVLIAPPRSLLSAVHGGLG